MGWAILRFPPHPLLRFHPRVLGRVSRERVPPPPRQGRRFLLACGMLHPLRLLFTIPLGCYEEEEDLMRARAAHTLAYERVPRVGITVRYGVVDIAVVVVWVVVLGGRVVW